jgi:hypothetical protein
MIDPSVDWRVVHVTNAPTKTAWRVLARTSDGQEGIAILNGVPCGYSSLTRAREALLKMVQPIDRVDNAVHSGRIVEE